MNFGISATWQQNGDFTSGIIEARTRGFEAARDRQPIEVNPYMVVLVDRGSFGPKRYFSQYHKAWERGWRSYNQRNVLNENK